MAEYEAYKDAEIGKVGSIPVHWETIRIGNLFKEVSDRYETGMTEDLPLLSVSEYYGVAKRSDKIADDSILVRADSLDGYKICRPGDIVSNIMLTWKGALGSSPYAGIVSPAYCVYRPNGTINSRYFHYLFRTKAYTDVFHVNSTGLIDSRLRLYTPKFFTLFALVPPMEEQNVIVEYLDKITKRIDAIISEAKASIEEYKAWKASIIYGAVTKGLNPDVKMKDSGIEWIGQIPEHWKKCKIKQVADAYNGDRSSNYPSGDDIVAEGVPFITSNNLNAIVLTTQIEKNKFITEEKYNSLRGAKLQLDDIVFCLRGSVGKCSINKQYSCGTIASSLVVFRARNIHPDYLNYVLQNNVITEMALTSAIGIGSLNLSAENIMGFPIAIPPMEEQRKIAESLNTKCHAIEVIISEKEALVADLESYKKSLIFEIVTGKRKVV